LQELALRDSFGEAGSPALRAMLKPREQVTGHWHPPPLPEEDFAQIAASRGALRKVSAGTLSGGKEEHFCQRRRGWREDAAAGVGRGDDDDDAANGAARLFGRGRPRRRG
jgi:hypothetical protein